ncbi:large ribosomal subunit protein eL31-like [Lepus europaeus]|uniref:large ribosomal subunit protein eL31-like n=1 Tax=Lepus europaeus TaxID=9983 RepID=UPI002B49030A|nr:large ribosomal subunit protein eL31-like [Lepus europaeus]
MAPIMKGGKNKKCHSAINKVVTQKCTINIHKHIHGVSSKKHDPGTLQEIWKFTMKEMGTPDVHTATRLSKAVWATGISNLQYHIHMRLFRKHNENEDFPNKLYTLVTYISVTILKNLESRWMTTD